MKTFLFFFLFSFVCNPRQLPMSLLCSFRLSLKWEWNRKVFLWYGWKCCSMGVCRDALAKSTHAPHGGQGTIEEGERLSVRSKKLSEGALNRASLWSSSCAQKGVWLPFLCVERGCACEDHYGPTCEPHGRHCARNRNTRVVMFIRALKEGSNISGSSSGMCAKMFLRGCSLGQLTDGDGRG